MTMNNFVHEMVKELSTMKHFTWPIMEGCYAHMVSRCGMVPPEEGREATLKLCEETLHKLGY